MENNLFKFFILISFVVFSFQFGSISLKIGELLKENKIELSKSRNSSNSSEVSIVEPENEKLGSEIIEVRNPANTATTTSSALPVKVLSRNSARTYARISNPSDTDVYLYLGNFASGDAASTTVDFSGVFLDAGSGTFEITKDNLWIGDIWATSTAASKAITALEGN